MVHAALIIKETTDRSKGLIKNLNGNKSTNPNL